jgi:hypothetical protein
MDTAESSMEAKKKGVAALSVRHEKKTHENQSDPCERVHYLRLILWYVFLELLPVEADPFA